MTLRYSYVQVCGLLCSENVSLEPAPGSKGIYAALSYRWGGWDSFTVKNTLETFKRKIEDEIIPIAFQEAAIVAQELEINYLWIDSVCIVQDDRDDWLEQATKMADVYENAEIVIAASSSPNPGTSFLQEFLVPTPPATSVSRIL